MTGGISDLPTSWAQVQDHWWCRSSRDDSTENHASGDLTGVQGERSRLPEAGSEMATPPRTVTGSWAPCASISLGAPVDGRRSGAWKPRLLTAAWWKRSWPSVSICVTRGPLTRPPWLEQVEPGGDRERQRSRFEPPERPKKPSQGSAGRSGAHLLVTRRASKARLKLEGRRQPNLLPWQRTSKGV